jgi:hypothetical protein
MIVMGVTQLLMLWSFCSLIWELRIALTAARVEDEPDAHKGFMRTLHLNFAGFLAAAVPIMVVCFVACSSPKADAAQTVGICVGLAAAYCTVTRNTEKRLATVLRDEFPQVSRE